MLWIWIGIVVILIGLLFAISILYRLLASEFKRDI